MKEKFYVTTAIDYVNARPHVGHAFEKVLTDTIARWNRQKGKKVFFLTGVDENAQKNMQAAQEKGIPIKDFIDTNTGFFLELVKKLNLSHDSFIRTTAKDHAKVVQDFLKKIIDKGDIYKGEYEGYYCVGCEGFIMEKDLVEGKCPEHNKKPEYRKEEAYFFKLSKYQNKLIEFVENYIIPDEKKNEILVRLKEGLNDLCVSRKGVELGVDFPGDKNFKVYVWVDALINYVSGSPENWPADLHVIGKGINWFHSVIWPALLMSAGYELPKKLLVHGYLISAGKKMSKSLGNVIDPLNLLNEYPTDTIRYSLLKSNVFEDSDYSKEILISRHNNELVNKLGNLVSRVAGLIEKIGIEESDNFQILNKHLMGDPTSKKIDEIKNSRLELINSYMEEFRTDKALNEIFAFIDICNEYVQKTQPWKTNDKKILYELKESILKIAELLSPFLPETSQKIIKQFKANKIKKSSYLFERIEVLEENNKINKPEEIKEIMVGLAQVEFSDWQKLDLRVAQIVSVEEIENADKLYKIEIDVGELGKRTICAGLKAYYSIQDLLGKKIIYFSNLKPRTMKGIESQGMLLAAYTEDESKVILLTPSGEIENGSRIG